MEPNNLLHVVACT
ncbi:hypothetical protein F383_16950 [Gossypium arboreum]|uniref:Uncharacterized protein n=1 Tax=Gossypium arboreum TaxID=29729 RepID=A0A0B0NJG3_GOSAR|nr:hypothetical protein F383_16950 [Gossypium arboreum]